MLNPTLLDHYRPVATPERPDEPPPPEVIAEPLPGARVLRLGWHVDARGGLMECHRESWHTLPARGDALGIDDAKDADAWGREISPARQVYVSATAPGVVKGWHLHCEPAGGLEGGQRDAFVALAGRILLVLVDLRGYEPAGPFSPRAAPDPSDWDPVSITGLRRFVPAGELTLDATRNPIRVEVPPGVAHGWLALGATEALILNCVSREYDGTQERRCDPHGPVAPGLPPYDWLARRDG